MEKEEKSIPKLDDFKYLKSRIDLDSIENISDYAFKLYLKYDDMLTDLENDILLTLITINEGDEFELSKKEIHQLVDNIINH